jgi:hypothetical protein
MNYRIGRFIAYVVGLALIFFGVLDVSVAIVAGGPSFHPFASRALDVALVTSGLFACVSTRLRYGGGSWSIVGAVLMGGGLSGAASVLEGYMRHEQAQGLLCARAGVFLAAGCCCLIYGHIRHRKKRTTPGTVVEAAASSP